ncbi:hypothetical protein TNCT_631921 [Trichonephila clavata]|uniref:Uncharacterized protein n=1 Tax=Trichonephila clavata TaxID=2740835 RepID=A0A8X6GJ61_TRICU|nr:hypothetical protein TNCT_631921 [Trichonephila clavata]
MILIYRTITKKSGKSGEIVNNLLIKLQVPPFKIPASEKELDKIILPANSKVVEPAAKNQEEKPLPAAPSTPPPSPRSARKSEERVSKASSPPSLSACAEETHHYCSPLHLQSKERSLHLYCFGSRWRGNGDCFGRSPSWGLG